jgi:hypothetical protein
MMQTADPWSLDDLSKGLTGPALQGVASVRTIFLQAMPP